MDEGSKAWEIIGGPVSEKRKTLCYGMQLLINQGPLKMNSKESNLFKRIRQHAEHHGTKEE